MLDALSLASKIAGSVKMGNRAESFIKFVLFVPWTASNDR